MPFSTAVIFIQLLMDTTNTLKEIESRMTAPAFAAVQNPERGPEGWQGLAPQPKEARWP
jgi:hypothetical protein